MNGEAPKHRKSGTEGDLDNLNPFRSDSSLVTRFRASHRAYQRQLIREWTDRDARRALGRFLLRKVDSDNLAPLDRATAWLNEDAIIGCLQSILLSNYRLDLTKIVCLHPSEVAVLSGPGGLVNISIELEYKSLPPLWNIFYALDVLLLPVCCNEDHWLLVFVDFTRATVVMYDSLPGNSFQQILWLRRIKEFLEYEHLMVNHVELPPAWTFIVHPTSQKQREGWNCGVFVCCLGFQFAESWSLDRELPSGSNICGPSHSFLQLRQQIKSKILEEVDYQKDLRRLASSVELQLIFKLTSMWEVPRLQHMRPALLLKLDHVKLLKQMLI